MDNKTITDLLDRIEEALGPLPTFTDDECVTTSGLEIDVSGTWTPADREMWRAWTGPRRFWGIEYHGPVYNYKSQEGSKPYTGKRLCNCQTCQEHVLPQFRPN